MAKTQSISGWNIEPVPLLVEGLIDKGVLSHDLEETIGIVWEYRDSVLHGIDILPDNLDAVRSIATFELEQLDKTLQTS